MAPGDVLVRVLVHDATARPGAREPVTSRHLLLNPPDEVLGTPAGMSVYLGDKYGEGGCLQAEPRGKVLEVMPGGS
ncbi:hypothetical protein [Streptomyces sp. NRRL B-3648]|uniref:hypothetical protein n=1 Tax=Streptomyces sp. NRRL B-3648 TaxID=1519493 RepID=UPI0006ADFA76|nr:hypothetical protein [Streptomyces sp. NRRL B-3648]KOV97320.1 hypothetical protein ADL04_15965 [Streptomyces sp. NRRL B-3648]